MDAIDEFIADMESGLGLKFMAVPGMFGLPYLVARGTKPIAFATIAIAESDSPVISLDSRKSYLASISRQHLTADNSSLIKLVCFLRRPCGDSSYRIPPDTEPDNWRPGYLIDMPLNEFKPLIYANNGAQGKGIMGRGNGIFGSGVKTNPVPAVPSGTRTNETNSVLSIRPNSITDLHRRVVGCTGGNNGNNN